MRISCRSHPLTIEHLWAKSTWHPFRALWANRCTIWVGFASSKMVTWLLGSSLAIIIIIIIIDADDEKHKDRYWDFITMRDFFVLDRNKRNFDFINMWDFLNMRDFINMWDTADYSRSGLNPAPGASGRWYEVWSMKYEVSGMKYEVVWSMQWYEVWSGMKYEVSVWSMWYEVWSMKYEVWSGMIRYEVWSM